LIILGIDPGTAITGYGLIEAAHQQYRLIDYGCIRTPSKETMPIRLKTIYDAMTELLTETSPDCVSIEQLFFNRNVTTAVPVGQARGVLILACAQKNTPIAEYTPLQVKQAVVGYGGAEKKQVQYMVSHFLKMASPPKSDDAADALALAICHSHYQTLEKIMKKG